MTPRSGEISCHQQCSWVYPQRCIANHMHITGGGEGRVPTDWVAGDADLGSRDGSLHDKQCWPLLNEWAREAPTLNARQFFQRVRARLKGPQYDFLQPPRVVGDAPDRSNCYTDGGVSMPKPKEYLLEGFGSWQPGPDSQDEELLDRIHGQQWAKHFWGT